MNVVERRARKLKKQEEYMARMKAADERNRRNAGVLVKEEPVKPALQEEEISYSVASITVKPEPSQSEDAKPDDVDLHVVVEVLSEKPFEKIDYDCIVSEPAKEDEEPVVEAPTEPVEAPEALEKEDERAKPEEVTSDLLDEPVVQSKKRGKKKKS